MKGGQGSSKPATRPSLWDSFLSENPSKRSGEKFLLIWSIIWIGLFGVIVASKVYEVHLPWNWANQQDWTDIGYMGCGLLLSVPNFILPNLFVSEVRKSDLQAYQARQTRMSLFGAGLLTRPMSGLPSSISLAIISGLTISSFAWVPAILSLLHGSSMG